MPQPRRPAAPPPSPDAQRWLAPRPPRRRPACEESPTATVSTKSQPGPPALLCLPPTRSNRPGPVAPEPPVGSPPRLWSAAPRRAPRRQTQQTRQHLLQQARTRRREPLWVCRRPLPPTYRRR
jgi:hypothetical protein